MPSLVVISPEQYDAMNAAWWQNRVLAAVKEALPDIAQRTAQSDLRTKIDAALGEARKLDVASEQAQIRYVCLYLLFGPAYFKAPEFAAEVIKHDNDVDRAIDGVFTAMDADLSKAQQGGRIGGRL